MLNEVLNPFFILNKLYSLIIKYTLSNCGKKFCINFPIKILGSKNIVIGSYFSAMGVLYLYSEKDSKITIGNNCSINTNVIIDANQSHITIGDFVLIGPNVVIRAANHNIKNRFLISSQASIGNSIIIEDDVWIGANVVVVAGVIIRRGTVVAAGAVVTKSTESYSIVAGCPAKKINARV